MPAKAKEAERKKTSGVMYFMVRGPLERAKEARTFAGMAGGAGGIDEDEQDIGVAVEADFPHFLHIAGLFAFVPEFRAATAPEDGFAEFLSLGERLGIHPCYHEYLEGRGVLDDGGNQSAFVEFQFSGHSRHEIRWLRSG